MKDKRGFISLEILFSLFILSLISILLIIVINNNINYLDRNRSMSILRLNTQNIIDKINYEKNNNYLIRLKEESSILIEEDNINCYIKKNIIDDRLWELEIKSLFIDQENIKIEWVIVIETP